MRPKNHLNALGLATLAALTACEPPESPESPERPKEITQVTITTQNAASVVFPNLNCDGKQDVEVNVEYPELSQETEEGLTWYMARHYGCSLEDGVTYVETVGCADRNGSEVGNWTRDSEGKPVAYEAGTGLCRLEIDGDVDGKTEKSVDYLEGYTLAGRYVRDRLTFRVEEIKVISGEGLTAWMQNPKPNPVLEKQCADLLMKPEELERIKRLGY